MRGERKRDHWTQQDLCETEEEKNRCVWEVNKEKSVKINATNRGTVTSDRGKRSMMIAAEKFYNHSTSLNKLVL